MTQGNRATGFRIDWADGTHTEERFDVMIATLPSFALPRLVDLPNEYRAKLQDVEYEGAIAVIWVLKHSLTPIYWLNISDPEIDFLLVLEQTNLVPPSAVSYTHLTLPTILLV